jgi:hypothetical protein
MTEEKHLNIKKRAAGLVAAAGLLGGLVTVAAPTAAHAIVVEQCGGFFFFGTLTPPLQGNGAPTATVAAMKEAKPGIVVWLPAFGAALNPVAGASMTVPGPDLGTCGGNFINDSTMSVGAKLGGVASCVPNYAGPNAATQYPLNGKLSIANSAKTAKEQVYIRVAGFDTSAGPDIISITGIDVKGSMVGASVSGEVGFDPVVKALVNTPGVLPGPDGLYGPPIDAGSSADNTVATVLKNQYYFDNNQAPPGTCGTTTPNPTGQPIGLIFGTDTTTLLGSNGVPLTFEL